MLFQKFCAERVRFRLSHFAFSRFALLGAAALMGLSARQAAHAQSAAVVSAPVPATLRLQKSPTLRGEFAYWFVNADRDMSPRLPLPASASDGSLTLPIPADFRQPDAQLVVLDAQRNVMARLPLRADASEAPKLTSPNLLENGDFAQQGSHWVSELSVGKANASVQWPSDEPAPQGAGRVSVAQFTITAIDDLAWHAQYDQPGLDLREGEAYTVSFWAKADRDRHIAVQVSADQGDYRPGGLNSRVSVRPQWRRVTLAFNAMNVVPNHARLVFVLGEALGQVEIADVRVQRGVAGPSGSNMIHNARFEEGITRWIPLQTVAPAQGVAQVTGAQASVSGPRGKALRVQVSTPGTMPWHVQIGQGGLNLAEDGSYALTFWARSETARRLEVRSDVDGADYHPSGLDQSLTLANLWRKYALVFTVNDTQGNKGRVMFLVGDQAGNVDIADLDLQAVGGDAAPAAPLLLTREAFTVAYVPAQAAVSETTGRGDAKTRRSHPIVGAWQSFHKDVGLTGKEYQRYRFVFDPNGTGSLQMTTLTDDAAAPPKSQQKETFKWQLVEGGPHVTIGSNVYTWDIEKDGTKQKLTLKNYEGKTYILFRQ